MTNYYEFYMKTDPSMFKVGQILKSTMAENTMTVVKVIKDNWFKRILREKFKIELKYDQIKVRVYEVQKSCKIS